MHPDRRRRGRAIRRRNRRIRREWNNFQRLATFAGAAISAAAVMACNMIRAAAEAEDQQARDAALGPHISWIDVDEQPVDYLSLARSLAPAERPL